MGWWIALAILVLLAILPLGVSVIYNEDGPLIRVIAGFIKIKVFPRKKKAKKEKPKKEKKKKKKKEEAEPKTPEETPDTVSEEQPAADTTPKEEEFLEDIPEEPKSGGSILDFLPLVKLGIDFLGEFFSRKLRVNVLELKITLGGGDPCDLATNYGRAWAAIGNLWPKLEEFFVIKKRDVNIQCDFTADKTLIAARLDISITLGRLLGLVFRYAWKALVTFLKIRKKRKGGAVK